jgi:hypothetical protein
MFVLIIAVWKMLLAINLPFGDSFYMPLPKQSWIMLILEMASRSSRCNGTPDLDGTKLGKKPMGFRMFPVKMSGESHGFSSFSKAL